MSGFFKKLLGKKKGSDSSSDADSERIADNQSSDALWAEHEISHDIQPVESNAALTQGSEQEQAELATDIALTSSITTSETITLNAIPNPEHLSKPDAEADIAPIPSEDIAHAVDFVIDPMDDITAQIQSEIAEAKRVKAKQEQRRKVLEATDKFRRPSWSDDVLKPDE